MSRAEIIKAQIDTLNAALKKATVGLLLAKVYDAAQELLDVEKPGEKVGLIDIQTTTFVAQPVPAPPEGPIKYYVMFRDDMTENAWPSTSISRKENEKDTLGEAVSLLHTLQKRWPRSSSSFFVLGTSSDPYRDKT